VTFKRSKTDLHSLPVVGKFRNRLRKNLTPAEAAFWNLVKNSQLDGRKFRRQHSIGKYIFDFYCASERIAIELDGEGHFVDRPGLNDRSKREFAESHGVRVIHFENKRIFEDVEWVIDVIRSNFGWTQRTTPSAEAAATPPS
jgi:very-short-patch-repair endonuclease